MRKTATTCVAVVGCVALANACARAPSNDPDLLLTGGVIYPLGNGSEPVEALAIRGDSIIALGTDAEVLQLAGAYTQQMPLEDSVVLPGGFDAWVDLEALGRWGAADPDLRRASSIAEVQAMVRNAAGEASATEGWVVGWGWDQNDWSTPALPSVADLDALGLDQPVALVHRSGLMAWVNGAALRALNTSGGSAATGILTGDQFEALVDVIAGDAEQRGTWFADGARFAAAGGITRAATSPLDLGAVEILLELEFRGLLPLRVDVRLHPAAVGTLEAGSVQRRLDESALVRIIAVGARLDGPLTAGLAALEEAGESAGGALLLSPTELAEAGRVAAASSLPLHLQASGDAAVARALEAVGTAPGGGMIVGFDLLPSGGVSADTGVDVAIAAARFSRDIYGLDSLLGPGRARRAHAWADIAALGPTIRLASDAPAYPLRPLAAVAAATTRQDAEGYPAGGWNPDQALPRERLLRALFADPTDDAAGMQSGDPADLVVWSEDPVRGDAGALLRAEALLTIVAGRVAYSRALVELPMDTERAR